MLKVNSRILNPNVFKMVWLHLRKEYIAKGLVTGKPLFALAPNTINVMGIRSNSEISFNLGEEFNNDKLLIYENTSHGSVRMWDFDVTMDPKDKKKEIAHLLKGIYATFVVRAHKWVKGRDALCSDIPPGVRFSRTDQYGNVTGTYTDRIGINIHNNNGFRNSSLGCTILADEDAFKTKFRPLILRCKNQSPITYLVTDIWDLNRIINEKITINDIYPPIQLMPGFIEAILNKARS